MKKTLLLFLATFGTLAAQMGAPDFSSQKIAIQNSILAKVNGNTISVMDVKKKMDLIFHQHYPQFENDVRARHQFYEMSWRNILMGMIDNELIISDASDKEIKITDGEIREAMEERFGPNVMQTLDKIGLTYDEAWKMLKNEQLVMRMSHWFIRLKAMSNVTPQDIRQAYRLYIQENPAYSEWKYRVISIRVDQPNDALADQVYQLLSTSGQIPENLSDELKKLEAPGISIAISNEFNGTDKELSEVHKASLAPLSPGEYSKPSFQTSRVDKKTVYRISYLIDKNEHPSPAFEDMAARLRDDLTQKAEAEVSKGYITKLRNHYGFNPETVAADDLHPFSLQ